MVSISCIKHPRFIFAPLQLCPRPSGQEMAWPMLTVIWCCPELGQCQAAATRKLAVSLGTGFCVRRVIRCTTRPFRTQVNLSSGRKRCHGLWNDHRHDLEGSDTSRGLAVICSTVEWVHGGTIAMFPFLFNAQQQRLCWTSPAKAARAAHTSTTPGPVFAGIQSPAASGWRQ